MTCVGADGRGRAPSAQPPRHSSSGVASREPVKGTVDVGRAVAGRGIGRAGELEDQAAEPGTDVGGAPLGEVGEEVLELAEVAELVEPGVGAGRPGRGQGEPLAVVLERDVGQQLGPHDAVVAGRLEVEDGDRIAPARLDPGVQAAGEDEVDLRVGVDGDVGFALEAGPHPFDSIGAVGTGVGEEQHDGQRMGAQVEQDPAAPTLGEEVAPAGPALEHAGVDVAERSEPAHERGRPQHDGGEGQVLGVAGPVPGGLVGGHELVGGPQRGGEGLLDDRRGAGGQRGERVGHVAGGGSGDHDDVGVAGQLVVPTGDRAELSGAFGRLLRTCATRLG